MPIPRHSAALAFAQLPLPAQCDGVTELRVHGVGGTPPDALLGDLAPEQASGDGIAGFYRSSDHRASAGDRTAGRDADRHVECYSWGGLTSLSKIRVLWLILLPFLLGNLAGWMCSVRTRESPWRFRLHRLSFGLAALALTVNASLITVLITADVLAYQSARAGLAGHQWWLAPLGWHLVSGHPARQVLIGAGVPVLLLAVLWWLARTSSRYEAVRPPYRGQHPGEPRKTTAAALDGGLASDDFWDGKGSVTLLTELHIAVAGGFLAIVLAVTAKALGSAHVVAWWWIAIAAGAATVVLAVLFLCLDALGKLRGSPGFLLALAGAALVSSGVFAWLQPGGSAERAADLPGMTGVIRWTAVAIAIPVAAALISMLLGLSGRSQGTFTGAPWITLMLAFGLLNTVMLGAEIWIAHIVGPVTNSAVSNSQAAKLYLPYVITSGTPLVAWAAVVTTLVFGLAELTRWWRARRMPAGMCQAYQERAGEFAAEQAAELKPWYWSGLTPFAPAGDDAQAQADGKSQNWERDIARAQFLGQATHDASWLLWGVIAVQLAAALCVWQLHWEPPVAIRNIGVALAGLVLPAMMSFLYSAWSDPARRRTIGVLWDVGTFWPRSYHPLAPPCYSERAVPELQRRMWWLHGNGGRVVLVAHSQGAMLATAALVQPGCRPEDDQPALITFGSPVCRLYGWGFPAYVTPELLAPLAPGGPARLSDWRNFFYPTDPIGGPVAGDLTGVSGKQVDEPLPDPAECWYVYGQNPPSPGRHSGYWADSRVWEAINSVAAARD
jgi:hypothetical protein